MQYNKLQNFQNKFPGTVLYAVKTNPHPLVIDTIIKSGIKNFDVASLKEIEQIKKNKSRVEVFFHAHR